MRISMSISMSISMGMGFSRGMGMSICSAPGFQGRMAAGENKLMRHLVSLPIVFHAPASAVPAAKGTKRPTDEVAQAAAGLERWEISIWQPIGVVQAQLIAGRIALQRRQRLLRLLRQLMRCLT